MAANEIETSKLVEVCRANDAAMVGIFGSFARGDATAGSDVDVLVRFRRPKSLIAIVRLERELTAILGRKVDLLTEASLSPYLRPGILHDLQVLYEAG
jgi:predicted nucleotidyltransferase